MLLATAKTAPTGYDFSGFLHAHQHILLVLVAVVVLAVIAVKIIKHLAMLAAFVAIGAIALLVLFPNLRQQLPFLKKAGEQALTKADLLQRREACNTLDAKLRKQCLAHINKIERQAAKAAAASAVKTAKK